MPLKATDVVTGPLHQRRQGIPPDHRLAVDDRDEHDEYAIHYAALLRDEIIGTVRIYRDQDGIWWGGRLAVLSTPFLPLSRPLSFIVHRRRHRDALLRAFLASVGITASD